MLQKTYITKLKNTPNVIETYPERRQEVIQNTQIRFHREKTTSIDTMYFYFLTFLVSVRADDRPK